MTASTDLDDTLANIRARAEAATEGPWTARHNYFDDDLNEYRDSDIRFHPTAKVFNGVPQVLGYVDLCEEDAEFIAHARADVELLLTLLDQVTVQRDEIQENRNELARKVADQRAQIAEMQARLADRERQHAERLAEQARLGDTGICRTCVQPITFATVEEPGFLPRTGWSDGARRDALVCFGAISYRHVPLVGRERGIWDAATKAATAGSKA